jgi:hypothetical protein
VLGEGARLFLYLGELKLMNGVHHGLFCKTFEKGVVELVEPLDICWGKEGALAVAMPFPWYHAVIIVRPDEEFHAHVWSHQYIGHSFILL